MKLTGIENGAVLQHVNGFCETVLHTRGIEDLDCSKGKLEKIAPDTWIYSGLPVGGPFTVVFYSGKEEKTVSELYVGDLWLLAGQSNMEGAGWLRKEDIAYAEKPVPTVRAFYMEDEWRSALPQLHQLWKSADPAHKRAFSADAAGIQDRGLHVVDFPPAPQKRGVGPGFFFARELFQKTGIPQGVIPCAVGGAPIEMWVPIEQGDNYYTAAYRRIIACGQRIRGIFWYQGEGYDGEKETYREMFEKMRQGFSVLCGTTDLPAVMAQTFRCTIPSVLHSEIAERLWSRYRNYLLEICREGKNLSVVATNDLELVDCIHLSATAQETLGRRAADAMLYLTTTIGCGEPEIESIAVYPHPYVAEWSELRIVYRNLRGALTSAGFPRGFMISEEDRIPSEESIQHIFLSGNTVRIFFELTPEQLRKKNLWYGFGHHFHCTITDEGGHAIPSEGPIILKKWI